MQMTEQHEDAKYIDYRGTPAVRTVCDEFEEIMIKNAKGTCMRNLGLQGNERCQQGQPWNKNVELFWARSHFVARRTAVSTAS